MLTRFQQTSSGQSISNEIRRLIVRTFTNIFNFRPWGYKLPVIQARCPDTARGKVLSFERGARLIGRYELSATKEKNGALLKELERLGLGVGGGDAAHKLRPTRSDAVLALVNSVLVRSLIESPSGPWNESNTSSKTCLIASRTRNA